MYYNVKNTKKNVNTSVKYKKILIDFNFFTIQIDLQALIKN